MSWKAVAIDILKPSNTELKSVIEKSLKPNFENVEVNIATCPGGFTVVASSDITNGTSYLKVSGGQDLLNDLSSAPFSMTSNGFGRNLIIAEVGGPGNLFPVIHKEKEFDLQQICKECHAPSAFVFGPGAGPWQVVGRNCEMVADANFSAQKVATKVAFINDEKSTTYNQSTIDSSKFSLMANLAVSAEPGAGEVVHCKCSIRVGKDNFPETIRKGLAQHYGEKCVSLGGIFLLHEGEAKLHVMPDFPGCPFKSTEEIDNWLRFFTMKAPLVCASVFHSYDPGYKLRMEHTHCYSDHGDAGHYHYDTTPETVVYEGWFAAAEKIFRFDEL